MPLIDLTAQANSLRADYGDSHAAHMPATYHVHLYTDDPRNGGVELTATGGYAALAVANSSANFPDPDAAAELTTAEFQWTATAAWSDVATWAQISDGAGVLYDGAPLPARINVTQADTIVRVSARIFYNEFGD